MLTSQILLIAYSVLLLAFVLYLQSLKKKIDYIEFIRHGFMKETRQRLEVLECPHFYTSLENKSGTCKKVCKSCGYVIERFTYEEFKKAKKEELTKELETLGYQVAREE